MKQREGPEPGSGRGLPMEGIPAKTGGVERSCPYTQQQHSRQRAQDQGQELSVLEW